MAISQITNKSITDATITADDMATGAVEGAMTTQIGGRRNLIINGAMQVAQRGDQTGVTSTGYQAIDRYKFLINALGTWSISQSSTAPEGFGNSMKITPTTADASPAAGDYFFLQHYIEGQDLQQLKKGTSNAQPVTMSFYVRCTKTGNVQVNLYDNDNSRIIGKVFSIDSANTWEYKTLTFDGDTTGALDNDNNLSLFWEMLLDGGTNWTSGTTPSAWEAASGPDRGAGTTLALADNTANEFFITGVQLEVGSVATPFEHISYGESLAACQRYYQLVTSGNMMVAGTTSIYLNPQFFCEMRSTPSISQTGVFSINNRTANRIQSSTGHTFYAGDTRGVFIDLLNFSSLLTDSGVSARYLNTNAVVLDAEI